MLHTMPGRPTRMIGVNFDVTRRREAELQLRQLDRLETVARLAGGVAHEANNQMTVVSGAAAFILKRDDLPDLVRQDAAYIQQAAERTAAITQQLLAFSRRQVLQPRVLDLNAAIRGFEAIIRRTVGEDIAARASLVGRGRAGAHRRRPIPAGAAQPRAQRARCHAGRREADGRDSRAAVQGAVGRNRSTGSAVRPGQYVELRVTDTGVGMDPQTLAHIFEPFFTTKGVGRGTGLGLSTVYGIVKQSNGYVFADSTAGQGATLRILLPMASRSRCRPAPARAWRGGTTDSGETVLVVDDEPVVRAMMVRALREAGYRVLEAEDGPTALARARDHAVRSTCW